MEAEIDRQDDRSRKGRREPGPDIEADPEAGVGGADIRVDEHQGVGGPDIKPEEAG